MDDKELKDIKQKNAEIFKKACVYTNVAYALVEVADTFMVDVQSLLSQVKCSIDKREKHKYNDLVTQGRYFKLRITDISKKLYDINEDTDALADSDDLYEVIKVIMDRCGGQIDILQKIRNTVEKRFKSRYGYLEDRK